MSHPFHDKLFVFIGRPERCSSREAYDALYAVGGVTDDRISTFTDYAVEFRHNGNSAKFEKALEYNHERNACDVIIDGKPFTWAQLEKNIESHEGWKIKIEFGDIADDLDADV